MVSRDQDKGMLQRVTWRFVVAETSRTHRIVSATPGSGDCNGFAGQDVRFFGRNESSNKKYQLF
jgi:hypothetical protein